MINKFVGVVEGADPFVSSAVLRDVQGAVPYISFGKVSI